MDGICAPGYYRCCTFPYYLNCCHSCYRSHHHHHSCHLFDVGEGFVAATLVVACRRIKKRVLRLGTRTTRLSHKAVRMNVFVLLNINATISTDLPNVLIEHAINLIYTQCNELQFYLQDISDASICQKHGHHGHSSRSLARSIHQRL